MATQAELRQRVFDNVYSASPYARPALQRLNGAVANQSTDTAVIVDDGTKVSVGDIIEFNDGEQGYVVSISADTLTVARAFNGTTAAGHADNEFIRINPQHTIKQVDDALGDALRDMDAQGIFQLAEGTPITLTAGNDFYELVETDVRIPPGVLSVFYQDDSTDMPVGISFRSWSDPFSGELTGVTGVYLMGWGNNVVTDTLQVVYAQSILDQLGTIRDPLVEDAAVVYSVARLLMALTGARLHDPSRWTDRTVQPGQTNRDGGFFLGQYQRMVWKAEANLKQQLKLLPGAEHYRGRNFRR